MNFNKIINEFQLENLSILGFGYFSVVLEDNEYALKLTKCDATLNLVKKLSISSKKYLPQIISFDENYKEIDGQNIYFIKTIKTFPITNENLKIKASQIRQLFRAYLLKTNFDIIPSIDKYQFAMNELSNSYLLKECYPDILSTFQYLNEFIKEYQCIPDLLNPKNYMQSKDGDLILSDPVASLSLFEDKSLHEVWKRELLFGSHWKSV